MDGYWTHEKFGKIPVGWEVKDLKDVCYINRKSLPTNTSPDFLFRYIPIECVSTGEIDFVNCPLFSFRDAPGRARRLVEDNDILVSGVRPNLKSFAIYKRPDGNNWICTTGIYVLTAKCKESSVLIYNELLGRIGDIQFYRMVVGSNYPAISDSDIRKIKILFPPLPEQKSIAKILSTVDDAIRSTNETIQKLERVKKSLMQNLLSGKMRPDGTMRSDDEFYKDEKMGLVPKGWTVKSIGEMFDSYPTASYSRSKLFEQGDCKYIHYGDIHTKFDRFLDVSNTELPFVSDDMIKRFVFLQDGDLVIADTSEDYDGVGKLVEIKNTNSTKVIAGLHTLMIHSKTDDLINGYKGYLFNEYRVRLSMLRYVTGIKVYSISKSCLAKVLVAVPPTKEQIEIKDKLDSVGKQIKNKQEKITKLELLKKSLMQQLLTGKVRVR